MKIFSTLTDWATRHDDEAAELPDCWAGDPLLHPQLQAMSQRALADLPIDHPPAATPAPRQTAACSAG